MAKLKRIGLIAWAILTVLLVISRNLQNNKIERLKNQLLLEEVNEGQKQIIIEYIPKKVKEIAPDAPAKADLGDKLYGGQ